ncbi:MAG: glycoside hydrolase family 16 protein, partial [Bacteroidetes bacterium]
PDPTATPPGWRLVWADEFDGTALDTTRWAYQLGDGCPDLCGWGNDELQQYRRDNLSVGDGVLTITARREADGTYTSARIRTKDRAAWTYGRFEIRARLPVGQGLWPAVWMLPAEEAYGGWAASGEIDIMEAVGGQPDEVFGTLHYGGPFPQNVSSGGPFQLVHGTFADDFFVFALEWEEGEIRWYINNVPFLTQTEWFSTGGAYPAPFDQPFYLLLNVAVGGRLPGPPDETTPFPQRMVVDYVRVYERAD